MHNALQNLGKVVRAIPKIIEVLGLAHNLLGTLLGHLDGSAKVAPPPAQAAPSPEQAG